MNKRNISNISNISYNGDIYKVREVNHKNGGVVIIGTTSLNNALIDPLTDDYRDRKAMIVDENIYAFVDDDILLKSSDEEFEEYINKYYD